MTGSTTYRLTFARIVRSEWTKMASLRSSWLVLAGIPLVLILMSAVNGYNNRERPDPSSVNEAVGGGFLLFALTVGVFGLLTMTGEYQSGLIRTSVLTVPRRLPVLWAKAIVLILATTPTMLFAQFGSFLANQAMTSATSRISLGDPEVLRSMFGAVAATVAAGLMGLGIGTMLRGTATSIVTFVIGLVVLPQVLLSVLPVWIQDTVLPFLPTLALQSLFDVDGTAPVLAPGFGAIAVAAWVVLLLGCGALVMRGRDA